MQSQDQIIFHPDLWSPEVYLYHPNNIPKSGWLKEPLAYKFGCMARTAVCHPNPGPKFSSRYVQGTNAENAFASAYLTRYNQQHPSLDQVPELELEPMRTSQAQSVVTHLMYYVSGLPEFAVMVGRQRKGILLFDERFGGKFPPYRAKQYSAGNHLYHPGNNPFPITKAEAHNATAYRLFHLAQHMVNCTLAYFTVVADSVYA